VGEPTPVIAKRDKTVTMQTKSKLPNSYNELWHRMNT